MVTSADGACACRKAFVPIHPPNVLSHLPPEAHLGPVDPETLPADAFAATEEELRIAHARAELLVLALARGLECAVGGADAGGGAQGAVLGLELVDAALERGELGLAAVAGVLGCNAVAVCSCLLTFFRRHF